MITNIHLSYDIFIDTTLLQCPWPTQEIKNILNHIKKKKKILIKFKDKEYILDIKCLLQKLKFKDITYWKEKKIAYFLIES